MVEFWNREKTAGRVTRTNVELVLYCVLILRTGKEVAFEKLYKEYKRYLADTTSEERKELVQDVVRYASIYYQFPDESELSDISYQEVEKRFFATLLSLENTTVYPLVMYLYDQSPSLQERDAMLQYLESYLVRRKLCRLTTKNYNKLFIGMKNALEKHNACVLDSMKAVARQYSEETNRMPTDDELENAIKSYSLYNKHAKGILYSLALYQHSHDKSDILKLPRNNFSVEHIMPKKWTAQWPVPDGGDEAISRRNYQILTLGNLTLVTKKLNSTMKNSAWDIKRRHLRQYSSLLITTTYLDTEWNDEAIQKRAEDLANVALKVWAV